HRPEKIFEHIAEAAEVAEWIAGARACCAHAALERRMAETVIGGAFLLVLQDVIGFVDFLEFDFGGVIAGILVGMKPHRELAIGGLESLHGCALLAFQGFVITALHAPTLLRPLRPSHLCSRFALAMLRPPPPPMRLRA